MSHDHNLEPAGVPAMPISEVRSEMLSTYLTAKELSRGDEEKKKEAVSLFKSLLIRKEGEELKEGSPEHIYRVLATLRLMQMGNTDIPEISDLIVGRHMQIPFAEQGVQAAGDELLRSALERSQPLFEHLRAAANVAENPDNTLGEARVEALEFMNEMRRNERKDSWAERVGRGEAIAVAAEAGPRPRSASVSSVSSGSGSEASDAEPERSTLVRFLVCFFGFFCGGAEVPVGRPSRRDLQEEAAR